MSILLVALTYFLLCLLYRQRQSQWIFLLQTLQTLKINKYRNRIAQKIEKHEKRSKLFLFWPIIDLYEWYESWQANRSSNIKS